MPENHTHFFFFFYFFMLLADFYYLVDDYHFDGLCVTHDFIDNAFFSDFTSSSIFYYSDWGYSSKEVFVLQFLEPFRIDFLGFTSLSLLISFLIWAKYSSEWSLVISITSEAPKVTCCFWCPCSYEEVFESFYSNS